MKDIQSDTGNRKKSLEKKVLQVTHRLYPYVKQRLKVAENHGILPRKMYTASGIIDEVVLKIYESKVDHEIPVEQLSLMMFTLVHNEMKTLFKKEAWHKDSVSTKDLLEEELKQLEEEFTVDADNDLIMNEELDDISYHLDEFEPNLLESEELQQDIADFFEIKERDYFKHTNRQKILRSMYWKLPMQTSNVIDLYILGKLNIQEIAKVIDSDIIEIKRTIEFVKENFMKYLK
jgi:DNA-directed RNA polymerase specialized sigma24 family protein